jgi:hypothetical protein
MRPAMCRGPVWRTVAHAVLVLSLVFNLRMNINLNQPKEGTHMANTINKSKLSTQHNVRSKNASAVKTTGTNCMGARARRSA